MFGRNIPIKPDRGDGLKLRIVGIWKTIQGEGPYAGTPAVFIRFAGCNLACFFCDTDFESGASEVSVEFISTRVAELAKDSGIKLVVLTGGEPMAQNLVPLIAWLPRKLALDAGSPCIIQIETAGTLWPEGLERSYPVTLVCSPKTGAVHPKIAEHCHDWKYIIRVGETDPLDGLPIYSTQEEGRLMQRFYRPPARAGDTIWIQPCDEYLRGDDRRMPLAGSQEVVHDMRRIRSNMEECTRLALRHGYRISLQTHKLLGVE